jgi:hypothetical protein
MCWEPKVSVISKQCSDMPSCSEAACIRLMSRSTVTSIQFRGLTTVAREPVRMPEYQYHIPIELFTRTQIPRQASGYCTSFCLADPAEAHIGNLNKKTVACRVASNTRLENVPKIPFKSGQFKVVNVISSRAGRRRGDWCDPGAGYGGKETPACSRVMESQQNATRVKSASSGQRRSRSPQRGRSAGSQRSMGSDTVGEKQRTPSAVFQRIKSTTEPVDEATKHEAVRALEGFDIFQGEGSVPRFQLFPEHLVAHAPGYWRIDALGTDARSTRVQESCPFAAKVERYRRECSARRELTRWSRTSRRRGQGTSFDSEQQSIKTFHV